MRAIMQMPAGDEIVPERRAGVRRAKLQYHHFRLMREDPLGEMFLRAVRRESSHRHHIECHLEFSGLMQAPKPVMLRFIGGVKNTVNTFFEKDRKKALQ